MRTSLLIALVAAFFYCLSMVDAMKVVDKTEIPTTIRHMQLIREINANPASTWTAGFNTRFLGASQATIRGMMGSRKTPESMRLPVRKIEVPSAIPVSFDSRTQWPQCASISEIRDQSACGSCWAFGAVESATDRICIETNATYTPHLSAADMMSCCSECGDGCDGGYPESAWQWMTTTGVVTGGNWDDFTLCESYPFETCDHHEQGNKTMCPSSLYPTPSCSSSCDKQSTYKTPYAKDKIFMNSSYSVAQDVSQIQAEIMANGPVEAAFDVYEDFLTYKTGVYSHQSGALDGGHAVKIIGWGVESNTSYWEVANSWNSDWGNAGYFRILRGADECGIESAIVAGLYKA